MIDRRHFLAGTALAVGALGAGRLLMAEGRAESAKAFEIAYSADEWRERLTPEQFYVLREHGTERAFTSPLDKETKPGLYSCAGCDLPLFSSEHKYDSKTGWPSFWQPLENAVGTQEDRTLWMVRTEVHCRRCGGHLGHVFDDGPPPTGLRYCMNGVAMSFAPGAAATG